MIRFEYNHRLIPNGVIHDRNGDGDHSKCVVKNSKRVKDNSRVIQPPHAQTIHRSLNSIIRTSHGRENMFYEIPRMKLTLLGVNDGSNTSFRPSERRVKSLLFQMVVMTVVLKWNDHRALRAAMKLRQVVPISWEDWRVIFGCPGCTKSEQTLCERVTSLRFEVLCAVQAWNRGSDPTGLYPRLIS